jgi:hypothetical protein
MQILRTASTANWWPLPATPAYCYSSNKLLVNPLEKRTVFNPSPDFYLQDLNAQPLSNISIWRVRLSKYSLILRLARREAGVKSVLAVRRSRIGFLAKKESGLRVNTSSENWKWQNSKWSYQGPRSHGLSIGRSGGRGGCDIAYIWPLQILGLGEIQVKYTCSGHSISFPSGDWRKSTEQRNIFMRTRNCQNDILFVYCLSANFIVDEVTSIRKCYWEVFTNWNIEFSTPPRNATFQPKV